MTSTNADFFLFSLISAVIEPIARSRVNIPFRVGHGDEVLEKEFVEAAKQQGLDGLAGHRLVQATLVLGQLLRLALFLFMT